MNRRFIHRSIPGWVFLVLSALWSPCCRGGGGSGELSLSDAVERALAFNLGLRIERISVAQVAEDLEIQRAAFDPSFQAALNARESRQAAAASELDGSDTPISKSQDGRIAVSKRTSWGTQLGLDGEMSRAETDSSYARLNPAYDTEMGIFIRQPLLKGAGPSVNLLGLRLGRLAVSRADLALRAAVLDLLKETERVYWGVVYAQAALDVRRLALAQAERLVRETAARRQAGLATDVDVVQARAEEAGHLEQVLLARQEALDAADRLSILLGRIQAETEPPRVSDSMAQARVPEGFAIEEALAAARAGQPEYLSQRQAIEGRRFEVAAARRNRYPTLDLSGRTGYSGQAGEFGDAAESMRRHDGYRWQVGLEFSAPWGLREERSRLRRSAFGLAQEELRLDQLDQNLILKLRTAGRAFTLTADRLEAAALTRGLREEQAAMLRARYSAGAATLRDTLDAENELEAARLREVRTRLDRIEAALELERLEGRLLDRHALQWADVADADYKEEDP